MPENPIPSIMKTGDKNRLKTRRLWRYEKIPYDLLLLADETVEAINKYISGSDIYVLALDDTPIAAYVLYVLNGKEVEIKNIAVDIAYQGQGVGKFLLQDAAIRARENGYTWLLIGTAESAVRQLNLYRKAGFRFLSVKKNFYIDHYPNPIVEEGVQLRHMVMLRKKID